EMSTSRMWAMNAPRAITIPIVTKPVMTPSTAPPCHSGPGGGRTSPSAGTGPSAGLGVPGGLEGVGELVKDRGVLDRAWDRRCPTISDLAHRLAQDLAGAGLRQRRDNVDLAQRRDGTDLLADPLDELLDDAFTLGL